MTPSPPKYSLDLVFEYGAAADTLASRTHVADLSDARRGVDALADQPATTQWRPPPRTSTDEARCWTAMAATDQ